MALNRSVHSNFQEIAPRAEVEHVGRALAEEVLEDVELDDLPDPVPAEVGVVGAVPGQQRPAVLEAGPVAQQLALVGLVEERDRVVGAGEHVADMRCPQRVGEQRVALVPLLGLGQELLLALVQLGDPVEDAALVAACHPKAGVALAHELVAVLAHLRGQSLGGELVEPVVLRQVDVGVLDVEAERVVVGGAEQVRRQRRAGRHVAERDRVPVLVLLHRVHHGLQHAVGLLVRVKDHAQVVAVAGEGEHPARLFLGGSCAQGERRHPDEPLVVPHADDVQVDLVALRMCVPPGADEPVRHVVRGVRVA